jgi:hypothetical protein
VTSQSEELLTLLNDTEAHDSLDDEKLCQLTFLGIGVYGMSNNQTMIAPLMSLYRVFSRKIDAKEKLELYRAIQDKLLEREISVNALLPFMLEECNFTIASSAALDYAVCRPLTDDDPMSGPRDIIDMINKDASECRVGLLAGLLLLGDSRVNELLWGVRSVLRDDEIRLLAQCRSGFLYQSTIEFYLRWLESLSGDYSDGIFGSVASGLLLSRENLMIEKVFETERIFPVPEERSPSLIRSKYELDEFAELIADRLIALEIKEPPPKVLPEVLRAWRIEGYGMH